jgi:hypothetical protein
MVDFDLDELLTLLTLGEGESDGDVREIFGQFACRRSQSTSFAVRLFKGAGFSYLVDLLP